MKNKTMNREKIDSSQHYSTNNKTKITPYQLFDDDTVHIIII